jgi:hypothetical protein
LFKLLLGFEKILIATLVFEKNANFFAENCRKSQKIVIITSTPGSTSHTHLSLAIQLHQERVGGQHVRAHVLGVADLVDEQRQCRTRVDVGDDGSKKALKDTGANVMITIFCLSSAKKWRFNF